MLASSAGAGWVGWITRQDQPRFAKLIAWATRLRNSVTVELSFILATTLGYWLWSQTVELAVLSWYAVNAGVSFKARSGTQSSMHQCATHPTKPGISRH